MIKKAMMNALILIGLFLLVIGCIDLDILYFKNDMVEESVTEITQLIMLLVTIICFFKLGGINKDLKRAAYLIGSFYIVLFIRENDAIFDIFYHGAWVLPALTVTALALYYAYRGGESSIQAMRDILATANMNMVITATMMLLVFSRLYGMGELWEGLMDDNYTRVVKNISEESIELLSYTLIAYGAVRVFREINANTK